MNHARGAQWPITKQSFSVDIFFRHQTPDSRVAGVVAIITHHEVIARFDVGWSRTAMSKIKSWIQISAIHPDYSFVNLHSVTRKADNSLDVTFRGIFRKPEDDNVASIKLRCP